MDEERIEDPRRLSSRPMIDDPLELVAEIAQQRAHVGYVRIVLRRLDQLDVQVAAGLRQHTGGTADDLVLEPVHVDLDAGRERQAPPRPV